MGIRFPLQTILDVTNTDLGAGSVAGGYALPFTLPQDTDEVIVKFTPSVVTGNMSATIQTTDDGGTTWYDVSRTSVLSNAVSGTAQWITGAVIGTGIRTGVIQAASVISAATGSAAASTLGSQQVSGLPMLSTRGRVFLILGGGATVNDGSRVKVLVNSQSKGV